MHHWRILQTGRVSGTSIAMMDTMTDQTADLGETMLRVGRNAREASRKLGRMSPADRTRGLKAVAGAIRAASDKILSANEADMTAAREKGLDAAMLDRLALDAARLEGIASSVEAVAELGDPIGRELARWERPNGLDIARVAVPLGVIGIIYESRPNVTADAGALCLRSGNAAILRCGSESTQSSRAIVAAMRSALKQEGLPEDAVQLVMTRIAPPSGICWPGWRAMWMSSCRAGAAALLSGSRKTPAFR